MSGVTAVALGTPLLRGVEMPKVAPEEEYTQDEENLLALVTQVGPCLLSIFNPDHSNNDQQRTENHFHRLGTRLIRFMRDTGHGDEV